MPAPSPLDLEPRLAVDDVMRLYPRLRTKVAARALMREVGAWVVAGSLYIRRSDLLAHESAQIASRLAGGATAGSPSPGAGGAGTGPQKRRPGARSEGPPQLPRDWWRGDLGDPAKSGRADGVTDEDDLRG